MKSKLGGEIIVKGHLVSLKEVIDEVEGACVEAVILLPLTDHNSILPSLYSANIRQLRLGRVSITQLQR